MRNRFNQITSSLLALLILMMCISPGFVADAASLKVDITKDGEAVTTRLEVQEYSSIQLDYKVISGEIPEGAYTDWVSDLPLLAGVDETGKVTGYDYSKAAIFQLWLDENVRILPLVGDAMAASIEKSLSDAGIDLETADTEAIVTIVRIVAGDTLANSLKAALDNMNVKITLTIYDENGKSIAKDTIEVVVTKIPIIGSVMPTAVHITNKRSVPKTVAVGTQVQLYGATSPIRLKQGVKFSMGSTAFDLESRKYADCTKDGLVTFTAPGKATVRVNPSSDAYAWAIDTVTFTVLAPEDYPLQSFEIYGETTVGEGETTQLATHKPLPEGAYIGKVTWSIEDTSIAVVDEYGNVTGIDGGSGINYSRTTTLTATASGVSISIPIKVTRPYSLVNKISSVEITGDTAVGIGTSMQFTETIYPARVSTNSGIVKKWGLMNRETGVINFADAGSSVSNAHASINSNGVVTGLTSGTITIVFRATLEDSSAQDTIDILIGNAITDFSLTGTATVTEGRTTQISMSNIAPNDYDPELLKNVVWSVEDPKIASVDENGLVTGLDAGGSTLINTKKTMLYATVGGVTRSIEITVRGSTIAYFTSANIVGPNYLIVDFPYTYSAVSTPERVDPTRHYWGTVKDDGSQPWNASNTMGSPGIPFSPNIENEYVEIDVETGRAVAKKTGSTTLYHFMARLYTTHENIKKDIDVIEIEPKNITITPPTKTEYIEGNSSLDLTGLEVNLTYNRSDIEKYYGDTSEMLTDPQLTVSVSDYTIGEINPDILDTEQFILISVVRAGKSYRGVFGITLESKKVDTIEIISEPKYAYKEGETELDITGLKVKANYLNAESEEVTDFVVDESTFDPLLLDTPQQITVTYTHAGRSASAYFTVIVYGTPVVSVDTGGYAGQWTNGDVTFILDSTHKLEGITYYYSENGESWQELSGDTFVITEETDTVYSFKAINGALQESEPTIAYIVKIDKVNPDFTLTPAVYTVINTDYDIAIDYTVTGLSGIIETLVNGIDITGQNTFTVTENGVYTVTAKAGTGATTTHQIEVNNIDKEKPRVTNISFEQINTGSFARLISTMTFGIFFNDRIEFTFEAEDDGVAGIEKIEYRYLDEDGEPLSAWKDYDDSLKPTQDPNFKGFVAVRAIDKATNVSDIVRSDGYVIDGTEPTDINIGATFNASIYESGKWVNDDVEIILSSYAFSDIYKYYVRIDSGEWAELSSNLYTATLHGSHKYEFKAESYTGLESEISSIEINIDKIKPIIRVEFSGTFGRWTSNDISFSFSIQDEAVSGITYFLDRGEGWEEITTGSELTLSESTMADYRFKAVNGAGVESVPSDLYRVMLDKTTPDIMFVKSITGPTSEPYSVILDIISGPSGIDVITMDGVDITGQESITVSENGVYLFTLKSVSGNFAAKNLVIDNFYIPELKITDIEVCEVGGAEYSGMIDGTFGHCFVNPKISIKAINTGSTGIKNIEYRLLNEDLTEVLSWAVYSDESPPVISENFTGYVQARVTDLSGNTSENFVSYGFTVDAEKPTTPLITATVDGAIYEGGWTGSAIEISLSSTAYSGILYYEYKEGTGEWIKLASNKFTVKNDGETTYEFRAVSSVNAISDSDAFSTKIEANIPTLQIGVIGTIGRKTGENITFTLSVYNQNSDVTYFYNSGDEWVELALNTLVLDETQKTTYTFKAVNGAGIESAISPSYEVDIDKTYFVVEKRPILSVSVNGEVGRYTNENITFNFTSTDTKGSVAYYYDNGSGFTLISGNTLTLSENQNKQYVFKAVDESGKSSIVSDSFSVMIDKTAPSVEIIENTALSTNEMKIANVIIGSSDSGIKSVTVNGEDITNTLQFTAHDNGVYTVTAITNSGIVIEKIFTVSSIDNMPPEIEYITIDSIDSSSYFFEMSGTIYAENGVLISIFAKDYGPSGIDIIEYRFLDELKNAVSEYTEYTDTVLINEEIRGYIEVKATDSSGNESTAVISDLIVVEKTKPAPVIINVSSDGDYSENYTDKAITLTPVSSSFSSIWYYEYNVDGGEWSIMTGDSLKAIDGAHIYEFRAISYCGLVSDASSIKVKKDSTIPVLTVQVDGKVDSFTHERVTFILTALSAHSDITYYYDDGTGFKALSGNILTINENAQSTYRFKAVNAAGTESAVSGEYIVKIDKDKPTITATANTTDWTNTVPVITVEAFANSGISEILYSENGGDWLTLDGTELTAIDGVNTYRFKAVSVSGMTSDTVIVTTKSELSAPVITADIDGIVTDWTNEKVNFTLSATNINSGVTYYVNYGGEWVALSKNTFTVKDSGIHNIEIKAISTAGSESNILTYTVKIDKDKPTITATANTTDWTNTVPVITVEAFANSGISEILYSENGGDWLTLDGTELTAIDGVNTYRFKAVSVSGMTSDTVIVTTKSELSAPVITADIDGIVTDWTNEKVNFTLSATNINSGVTYYVNYGGEWVALSKNTFTVKDSGIHNIEIKAISTAGSESNILTYTVKIDKDKPTITATANTTDWTNTAPIITVEAFANSGISEILYSENGGDWLTLDGTELTAIDGVNTYRFKAVSVSGMTSDTVIVTTKSELSAPVITADIDGIVTDWTNEKVNFTLSATNINSGVTYYVNYGGEWVALSKNTFTVKDSGIHNIEIKAISTAGSESNILTYTVKIDKDKPTITATANTTDWTNTAPIITVEAFANSGISEILYSENGGDWLTLDGTELTAIDGVNTYRFKAVSVSGMTSDTVIVTTKSELSAPVITADIDGIVTDWTNEKVSFTLSATNINSGVTYYVNYGGEWVALSKNTFTVKDSGIHNIEIKAISTAGSESNILTYTVKIDKDKPTITVINTSDEKWVADSVTISVNAQSQSGIESILYTLDGDVWSALLGDTLSFDEDCEKTIAIKAVSNSGLESDVVVTNVKIEKSAPIINVSFKPVKNKSKIEQVAFGLTSENTKSGATYYYNDGSGWQIINANELLMVNIKSSRYTFKVVNGAGISSEVSKEFRVEVPSEPSTNTSANKDENSSSGGSTSIKPNPKVSYYQYSKDGVNWTDLRGEETVNAEKYVIRPVYKDGTAGEEIEVYIAKGDVDINSENIDNPSEPTVNIDKDGDENDGNSTKTVMLIMGLLVGAGATSTLFVAGGRRRKKESI